MKGKKYLKTHAAADEKSILAQSGSILENLEAELEERPAHARAARSKPFWACLAGLVASVILLVSVVVFCPSNQHSMKYLKENFESCYSDILELNESLHEFTIINLNDSAKIEKTFDRESGDTIYYRINIQDSFIKMELVAVCNPYYSFDKFKITNEFTKAKFEKGTIYYKSEKDFNSSDNIRLIGSACIRGERESIYITSFSKKINDPEETFPQAIQEFIQPAEL